MRREKERREPGWVGRYRLFLCLVLLAVLLVVGGFYYSFCERTKIPEEGTLVRLVCDEGQA